MTKFSGLLCTDGRLVCRKPLCFAQRYERDARLKVTRYVKPDEAIGHSCINCGDLLVATPTFLRQSRSTMLG